MLTTNLSDILAEPTLTELIDNNNAVLENKIKTQTLRNFIDLLNQELHEKYVKLLRAVVTSNGEAMTHNQSEISKMIFDDERIKNRLIYPLKYEDHQN